MDGNKTVLFTQDGSTWDKIGLEDANVNRYGLDSGGADDVWVSGGNGMLFHYNGADWTPTATGDAELWDVVVATDDPEGLAVGGGVVFGFAGGSWDTETTPTGENLTAVLRGSPAIAAGAAGCLPEHNSARTAVG